MGFLLIGAAASGAGFAAAPVSGAPADSRGTSARPRLTVSPAVAAPGTSLRVAASGLPSRARVRVNFVGHAYMRRATRHGRLRLRLIAPDDPGRHSLVLRLGRKRLRASVRVVPASVVPPRAPKSSPPVPPSNTGAPTIAGTAEDGRDLTATTGTWSGDRPIDFAFQWRRCDSAGVACVDIPGAAGTQYHLGSADVDHAIRVRVTASNDGGSAPADSAPTATVIAVLAAAGDIACLSTDPVTPTTCQQTATGQLLVDLAPSLVTSLGDHQYGGATLQQFEDSFDPSWGRVKPLLNPAPGNHDYDTSGAAGYFAYFGGAAGDAAKGYYSYDVGSWHIVALNSECAQLAKGGAVDGCATGSPQQSWLDSDLAATTEPCILAYWHRPLFTSGGVPPATDMGAIWQTLMDHGADVVLDAHERSYERFARQDALGNGDPNGPREFVVGTGGKGHGGLGSFPAQNEIVGNSDTFGVLTLTLRSGSFDWRFVPIPGGSFSDSGSATCH